MSNGTIVVRELWDVYCPYLSLNDVLSASITNSEIYINAITHGFNIFLENFGIIKTHQDRQNCQDSTQNITNVKSILSMVRRETFNVRVFLNDRSKELDDTFFMISTPAVLQLCFSEFTLTCSNRSFILNDVAYKSLFIPWESLTFWENHTTARKRLLCTQLKPNFKNPINLKSIYFKLDDHPWLERFMISRCVFLHLIFNGTLNYVMDSDRNMKNIQAHRHEY